MTIEEYMSEVTRKSVSEGTPDLMAAITHIWSDDACAGYVIKAMEAVGATDGKIISVLLELRHQMKTLSVPEAEKVYKDFLPC